MCYGSLKIKLLWRVPTFAVFWVNIFADRIAVFLLKEELLFGTMFISADPFGLGVTKKIWVCDSLCDFGVSSRLCQFAEL